MSNAAFRRDFAALLNKAGDKAELVVRNAALELQSGMVAMAVVDTGRFKGNFQCGVGAVNTTTDSPPDKDGGATIGRTQAVLEGWKVGQTIWLTNSLPYARRLEYGHSMQMPNGCVRLTVQNYSAALAKAVASVKD